MFRQKSPKPTTDEIKPFLNIYYDKREAYKKEESKEIMYSAFLTREGVKSVLEYYEEKYHIDTKIFYDYKILAEYLFLFGSLWNNNTRKSFILILDGKHAVPIIYIKDNNKEILLYADSKGSSAIVTAIVNYWINKIEMTAHKFPMPAHPIQILHCDQPRQADFVTCFVDAIIFCKDATAIDKKTGAYILTNLFEKLSFRKGDKSKDYDNYNYLFEIYSVKLPNELLKTAQLSEFVENNREESDRIIHKKETLSFFRGRYTDEGSFILSIQGEDKKIENPSNYSRKKGLKLINIIEIQFYLKEIKYHLGSSWKTSMRDAFIEKAKTALASKSNLYDCAKIFLKDTQAGLVSKKQRI